MSRELAVAVRPWETLSPRLALGLFPGDWQHCEFEPLGQTGGFSGAAIWRVRAAGRSWALRATPEIVVETARLSGLHRLLRQIHPQVPVLSVPLPARSGMTYATSEDTIWQIEPWMPGAADYRQYPSQARLADAMRVLAQWHRAAARFDPRDSEKDWYFVKTAPSPALGERARLIVRWNHLACEMLRRSLLDCEWPEFRALGLQILENYLRLAPLVQQRLSALRDTAVPLHPCLRDIWHDHVLFQDQTVTGLIDAHACRSDNVATDLSRLLGTLVADDLAAWDYALQCYQELRPLSLDELALVQVLDATQVLLSGLTWLDWYCIKGRRFPNPERVIDRLTRILGRLRQLARRLP